MGSLREVKESPLKQGSDERIGYIFDFTELCEASSDVSTDVSSTDSFQLYDMTNAADVTATKLTGAGSVATYFVTSPLVIELVAGDDYRLTSKVVISDNTLSAFALIRGE